MCSVLRSRPMGSMGYLELKTEGYKSQEGYKSVIPFSGKWKLGLGIERLIRGSPM